MDELHVEISDHIATVTLDRPPVNAVTGPLMDRIRAVFSSFADDRDVRAAIFTSAGERAFIGGVDLEWVANRGGPDETAPMDLIDRGRAARDAMWAILDCAVPVVGAINGAAIGAGAAFAACCDILVAAESAVFAMTEINVGLLGASSHLQRMVGPYKAREMFFLGERVPAEEMHRRGVLRAVVARDELYDTARSVAAELAQKSPIALRLAKESMNRAEFLPLKEAYRLEQEYTTRLAGFEDSAEARRAYLEKREPDFRWR